MCLNGTCCNLAITIVWTELFGAMRAPYNRQHELYPIRPKNKSFDLNFDLFMVKLWSNFGQNRSFQQIDHNLSFFRARRVNESSLKSLS